MLKLSTKCWISAFNAQGSRGIIVAVQVGAPKIYVAAAEPLRKKERQGETQELSKLLVFLVSPPPWMLMYFLAGFFWISPCVLPNSGYWCCLFLTLRISLICRENVWSLGWSLMCVYYLFHFLINSYLGFRKFNCGSPLLTTGITIGFLLLMRVLGWKFRNGSCCEWWNILHQVFQSHWD